VVEEYRDIEENILGLKLDIDGIILWIISVYGPNTNDIIFFRNIDNLLLNNQNAQFVLCGDWNTTISSLGSENNIDITGMQNPPSIFRSNLLTDIRQRRQLTDPYRALWPDKRDFTYVPRTGRLNRSRIDFFLCSDSLLYNVTKCDIGTNLTSSIFDHKPIYLTLGPTEKNIPNSVFNSTIEHPRFMAVVKCASIDCYLNHADPDTIGLNEKKNALGNTMTLIRQLNDLDWICNLADHDEVREAARDGLTQQLDAALQLLPGTDDLDNLILNTDPDIFFEVLCINIKNELMSFQGWLKKLESCKLNRLRDRINFLKSDFLLNRREIFDLEGELTALQDAKLQSKVSCMKIFENLNSERPTPAYLALTKNNNEGKLSNIKKPDGLNFGNDQEREDFIVNNFAQVYNPDPAPPLNDTCIEDFLGPAICNSNIVQDSKLTNDEKTWLDRPITMAELDLAAKKGKLRSAPGADGFSNTLIIKCWSFFRFPFFRYVQHCFNTGILTHNFRSATIKLIPKKGDQTNIKNWRPISLLSNFYKILSRTINTRLNKFVNRICSRAQKGYNPARYTQEVLINVWGQIHYCKENNIKGAVVAIDMAKAFDTLSHDFLGKVYDFFNFGPEIKKWLNLLGNRREACIILDGKKKSKFFNLGCGRPQGDNVSPNTFNFAEQILIFKFELDPEIKRIPRPVPNIINVNPSLFQLESNRDTDKNESLADDNTSLTILEQASLSRIKTNLNDFANLSGLRCNFDKSCVMPTFEPSQDDVEVITNLGFKCTDNFKLLGLDINRNLDNIPAIFEGIKQKILTKIRYWERFKLSLPGRITISKTFLISQLNYVGCFLMPPDDAILEIQQLINAFVKGTLNLSTERIYLPPELGGLGMFDLKTFLQAQIVTWIARAYKLPADNWQYDLQSISPHNNIALLRPMDFETRNDCNPILRNFAVAYKDFYGKYTQINGNYKSAYIFDNPAFKWGPDYTGLINKRTFGIPFYNNNHLLLRKLRYSDCFSANGFKSLAEFHTDGLPFTLAGWMQLRACILHARDMLAKPDPVMENLNLPIEDFLGRFKKGSKKFRRVLDFDKIKSYDVTTARTVRTFFDLVNLPVPDKDSVTHALSSWKHFFIGNCQKEFVFKFRSNILPLNNRINAYDREVDPRCTFCRIADPATTTRESFVHIFYTCRFSSSYIAHITEYFFDLNLNELEMKMFFWQGMLDGKAHLQPILLLFWDTVRFCIYRCRVRRKISNGPAIATDVVFLLKSYRITKNILAGRVEPVLARLQQRLE
jgi:Reverse transcriptase (RNA-dependent DNA polymerase)